MRRIGRLFAHYAPLRLARTMMDAYFRPPLLYHLRLSVMMIFKPMRGGPALAFLSGALLLLTSVSAMTAPSQKDAALTAAWRATITETPVPGNGCYTAEYPNTVWTPVTCSKPPARPLVPAARPGGRVVGNGNDFSAETATPISSAVGSFPVITGLTQETASGFSDTYSLQLNSSYYTAPVCDGAKVPSQCRAWMQYAYINDAPDEGSAFMEIWLINYGNKCPTGWGKYATDCYYNSDAISVPNQSLSALDGIQVAGATVAGGNDTVTMTAAKTAYAVTMPDSQIDLAGNWNTAEYNLFGDGGGDEAVFNPGTKMTVKVKLKDGSSDAPT
jgi:hypothetical protein